MVVLKMPKCEAAVTLTLSEVALKGLVRFGSLQDTISAHAMEPFDSVVIDFVSDFSRQLLKSTQFKRMPDVVSLAYWCRRSNLEFMKKELGDVSQCVGRGVVFHIPPSNVPLNFAYSLFAGLLSGNTNIVRLSSSESIEVSEVLSVLTQMNDSGDWTDMVKRLCVIEYGHEDSITSSLSLLADARVIWGGDQTVQHIRSLPTKARSLDVSFADRVSISLLSAGALLGMTDLELRDVVTKFYVDGYTFNQNACSSPRLVVWHGTATEVAMASEKFWTELDDVCDSRAEVEAVHVMNRLVEVCESLVENENIERIVGLEASALRVALRDATRWEEISSLRFGTFSEARIFELQELEQLLGKKVQTIGYFGYDSSQFMTESMSGIRRRVDRIVPLGQALSFELIWDGYDLIRYLSKHVVIR
jgi:hypothetical protein